MSTPKETSDRLKAILDKELAGNYYQAVVVYSDGKHTEKGLQIHNTSFSNMNAMEVPFTTYHGVMRGLEATIAEMLKAIYNPQQVKEEQARTPGQPYYR
jgi:hypothetical protein